MRLTEATTDNRTEPAPREYIVDVVGDLPVILMVRQIINSSGSVVNFYTYEPFGECFATECTAVRARKTTENPFKFTGQYFDAEIGVKNVPDTFSSPL